MGSDIRNGNRSHLERVSFDDDPAPTGVMPPYGSGQEELTIERNNKNDHCFFYNVATGRFELARLGSATIVDLLEIHRAVELTLLDDERVDSKKRPLAFFDIRGRFFDSVLLSGLYPNIDANSRSGTKHTAIFEYIDEEQDEPFAIAIDSIRFLSLSKPDPAEITEPKNLEAL